MSINLFPFSIHFSKVLYLSIKAMNDEKGVFIYIFWHKRSMWKLIQLHLLELDTDANRFTVFDISILKLRASLLYEWI